LDVGADLAHLDVAAAGAASVALIAGLAAALDEVRAATAGQSIACLTAQITQQAESQKRSV
jgi:hypothetical protein